MMLLSGFQAPVISHNDAFEWWESNYLGILSALGTFIFQHVPPPHPPPHRQPRSDLFAGFVSVLHDDCKPTCHHAGVTKQNT